MTDKAIEAGARAILERTKVTSLDDADGLATLVIEAAIASGALVPASQLAAERERCAKVAERYIIRPLGIETAKEAAMSDTARRTAAAIRALEPPNGRAGT